MSAAPAPRRTTAPEGSLSIGQVLTRLSGEFPGLSASKLRFLEVQGIVTPRRTDSGYRKFSHADVERLRLALTLQRDHFLPLAKIRQYMQEMDAGRSGSAAVPAPPTSIVPGTRRYRRAELLTAAGATPALLDDGISAGVLPAAETFTDQHLTALRSLVALAQHGIEPRHLRSLRQSAEREVALVESALAPLLRRSDASARGSAGEIALQLTLRMGEVRQAYVRAALGRLIG